MVWEDGAARPLLPDQPQPPFQAAGAGQKAGCEQNWKAKRLRHGYGFPSVTAMPKGPSAPVMKLWLTSLPSRFARPMVVPV